MIILQQAKRNLVQARLLKFLDSSDETHAGSKIATDGKLVVIVELLNKRVFREARIFAKLKLYNCNGTRRVLKNV